MKNLILIVPTIFHLAVTGMEARKAMFTNSSGPRDSYHPMIQLISTLTQMHKRLSIITNHIPNYALAFK